MAASYKATRECAKLSGHSKCLYPIVRGLSMDPAFRQNFVQNILTHQARLSKQYKDNGCSKFHNACHVADND